MKLVQIQVKLKLKLKLIGDNSAVIAGEQANRSEIDTTEETEKNLPKKLKRTYRRNWTDPGRSKRRH